MTSPRRSRLWLLAFLASILLTYSVFFTGSIVSGDNIAQYYQTVQIVDRHRITFSTTEVADILRAHDLGLNTRFSVNRDGTTFTAIYGLGQSLMALPLFVVTRVVKGMAHLSVPADMTLWCLNWLLFAVMSVALVLQACRLMRVPPEWRLSVTCAAAFASPIWMFADLPFNVVGDMLAALTVIDLCLWFESGDNVNHRAAAAAAAALAGVLVFAMVIRPFAITALPGVALWFAWSVFASSSDIDRKTRIIVAFALPLAIGGAALALFDTYYFGSPIATAYHDLAGVLDFNGPWRDGLTGILFSPLKSPLYFFPLCVLLPFAIAFLVMRNDRVGWFAVFFLAPQIYLMPKYSMWDGGPDLFGRFWLRIVPIVLLSIIASVRQLHAHKRIRTVLLAICVLLTASGFRAQFLTVMTDERDVYARVATALAPNGSPGREFDYHESGLNLLLGRTPVSSAQLASLRFPRQFLFFRDVQSPARRLPVALLGVLASIFALWRTTATEDRLVV